MHKHILFFRIARYSFPLWMHKQTLRELPISLLKAKIPKEFEKNVYMLYVHSINGAFEFYGQLKKQ